MTPGKLSAQAGHAYTDALWTCLDQDPETALSYRCENGIGGSKVTIKCKNIGQLERAARECAETALGIGPCTREQCRHITKRFRVVS